MCATCGCEAVPGEHDHHHHHHDGDGHHHHHADDHHHHGTFLLARPARTVALEEDVLAKNDALAAENRALFQRAGIAAFNFTSAPGSGKTALLETLIRRISDRVHLTVIEGDQETERDAERIRATGVTAIQVNTQTGCHLDARMVRSAFRQADPPDGSLLLIENVGNLVCPALFDLGERAKVVVMSVTEGEDKPLKYPHMFRAAEVLVITKVDLLPHLDFDLRACLSNALRVNPKLRTFQVSSKDQTGIPELGDWMASQVARARA